MTEREFKNVRYTVISRGEDKPEILPQAGDTFDLSVIKSGSDELSSINVAITAESVRTMGHYSHVRGWGKIDTEELLRCIAKYETERHYVSGTPIGGVIFKKIVSEE